MKCQIMSMNICINKYMSLEMNKSFSVPLSSYLIFPLFGEISSSSWRVRKGCKGMSILTKSHKLQQQHDVKGQTSFIWKKAAPG